ncbi:hypothetical protein Tco_0244370, partial [Tanacetum coccineum]
MRERERGRLWAKL